MYLINYKFMGLGVPVVIDSLQILVIHLILYWKYFYWILGQDLKVGGDSSIFVLGPLG
jgi:hypothetical protein